MRKYIFSDEAGDFDFSRNKNASKYFVACAISVDHCDSGLELMKLRRELIWGDLPVGEYFHACEDKQSVRDKVFDLMRGFDFRIYAQVLEKAKAQPHIRATNHRFYQHAWLYLFKHAMKKIASQDDEFLITTASIGTKKGQAVFTESVRDVVTQTVGLKGVNWKTNFCPAMADPCLQIADYCTWAIQRKWERDDSRSYDLIKDKISYEYDLWGHGKTMYY